jgi:hypothetical protein
MSEFLGEFLESKNCFIKLYKSHAIQPYLSNVLTDCNAALYESHLENLLLITSSMIWTLRICSFLYRVTVHFKILEICTGRSVLNDIKIGKLLLSSCFAPDSSISFCGHLKDWWVLTVNASVQITAGRGASAGGIWTWRRLRSREESVSFKTDHVVYWCIPFLLIRTGKSFLYVMTITYVPSERDIL